MLGELSGPATNPDSIRDDTSKFKSEVPTKIRRAKAWLFSRHRRTGEADVSDCVARIKVIRVDISSLDQVDIAVRGFRS